MKLHFIIAKFLKHSKVQICKCWCILCCEDWGTNRNSYTSMGCKLV